MVALALRGRTTARTISTTPEVDAALAAGSPVCIGVSGGKDSSAVALATFAHLDKVGHAGPRLLVHADLGVVEWHDSLPVCERLAKRLGCELLVVRRKQGDMMDRWEQRWADNVARWEALSCVKIILPWSTPAMRFCTSELKVDQITRALVKRFPGRQIVNVTGVRREESTERSKAPTCKAQPKLTSKTHKTTGIDWLAIADWTEKDVYEYAAEQDFALHEGYTRFGSDRISCVLCMLATKKDHEAAMRDERNRPTGFRMVELEVRSTFAFQGNRWLGDTLADILPGHLVAGVECAKQQARSREAAEALIPKHLLYHKGWPTCVPSNAEAELLCEVRRRVADTLGLKKSFTRVSDLCLRYSELLEEKALRDAAKATKAGKILAA